jgi:hypothetical protein
LREIARQHQSCGTPKHHQLPNAKFKNPICEHVLFSLLKKYRQDGVLPRSSLNHLQTLNRGAPTDTGIGRLDLKLESKKSREPVLTNLNGQAWSQ